MWYATTLKEWYAKHADYKKKYRQGHSAYRRKNVLYLKTYRQKTAMRVRHSPTREQSDVP